VPNYWELKEKQIERGNPKKDSEKSKIATRAAPFLMWRGKRNESQGKGSGVPCTRRTPRRRSKKRGLNMKQGGEVRQVGQEVQEVER